MAGIRISESMMIKHLMLDICAFEEVQEVKIWQQLM